MIRFLIVVYIFLIVFFGCWLVFTLEDIRGATEFCQGFGGYVDEINIGRVFYVGDWSSSCYIPEIREELCYQ